jgi:hypothetical protein
MAAALLAGRVRAQPTLAQATPEQQQAARDEYQRGLQAYQAARYDEALKEFEASYGSVASPNTGLMVGRCLRALEQPAAAYRAFADVVDLAEAWGNDRYSESASAARGEMAQLKPRVVMLLLDVQDESGDARLTVGELEVPRRSWHRPFASEPGTIDVVLAGAAGEERRELVLEPGVAASVELHLAATKPAETPLVQAEPVSAPPRPPARRAEPHSTNTGLRIASYVTAGTGAAAIVGFAILGSMANSRFDALQRECPQRNDCDPALRDEAEAGDHLQTAGNVALVAGSLLIATGVTLFVLSLDEGNEVQVAATGSGVTLRGAL